MTDTTKADGGDGREARTVHELQSIALEAAETGLGVRRPSRFSRAAELHLIDMLSRFAVSGLALIAGASIFLAVAVARDAPLRGAVWGVMIVVALYASRRLLKEFRGGERIASHPFRWRAWYASSLAVVGAGFGAGAILLTASPLVDAAAVIWIVTVAAAAAAGVHAAHRNSAAAILAPALCLTLIGAFRAGGAELALPAAIAGALAAITIFIASARIRSAALARFPRTTMLRRAVETAAGRRPQPVATQQPAIAAKARPFR